MSAFAKGDREGVQRARSVAQALERMQVMTRTLENAGLSRLPDATKVFLHAKMTRTAMSLLRLAGKLEKLTTPCDAAQERCVARRGHPGRCIPRRHARVVQG